MAENITNALQAQLAAIVEAAKGRAQSSAAPQPQAPVQDLSNSLQELQSRLLQNQLAQVAQQQQELLAQQQAQALAGLNPGYDQYGIPLQGYDAYGLAAGGYEATQQQEAKRARTNKWDNPQKESFAALMQWQTSGPTPKRVNAIEALAAAEAAGPNFSSLPGMPGNLSALPGMPANPLAGLLLGGHASAQSKPTTAAPAMPKPLSYPPPQQQRQQEMPEWARGLSAPTAGASSTPSDQMSRAEQRLRELGPPPTPAAPGGGAGMAQAGQSESKPVYMTQKTRMCAFFQQGMCTKSDCGFAHSAAELKPTQPIKPILPLQSTAINSLDQSRAIRAEMRKMLSIGGIQRGKFPIEGWKCRCGTKNKYWHAICGGKTTFGCKTSRNEGAIANYAMGNYDPVGGKEKPVISVCLVLPWISPGIEAYHLQTYFDQYGTVTSVKGPIPDAGGQFNRAYVRFAEMNPCIQVMSEGEDHYPIGTGDVVVLVEPAKDQDQPGKGGKGSSPFPQPGFGRAPNPATAPVNPSAVYSYGHGGLSINKALGDQNAL